LNVESTALDIDANFNWPQLFQRKILFVSL
jgi:hypothetical protein